MSIEHQSHRFKNIALCLLGFAILLPFQNCGTSFDIAPGALIGGSQDSRSEVEEVVVSPEKTRFDKASQVLQAKCVSCHKVGGSAAFSPLDFTTENQFVAAGLISAGDPKSSKLIYRLKNYPDTSITNRTMPSGSDLTAQEYTDLYNWVSGLGSTVGAFTCDSSQSLNQRAIAKNLKRLSKRQYTNTLQDLLSRAFSASSSQSIVNTAFANLTMPVDDDTSFSRFDSAVIRQHMKTYFDASDLIATAVTTDPNYSTLVTNFINLNRGTCTTVNISSLSTECVSRFIANFGSRALRRPLNATEATAYLASYSQAGGSRAGISAVVFRFLMAPSFLYKIENNETNMGNNLYKLSSYSVAARLSYLFWNSMPDESLLAMAAAKDLSTDVDFSTALNYVADNAKSDDAMKEFINEWLKLNKTPQFSTTNTSLQFIANGITLDSALRTAMISEVEELGSYIYKNNLTFQDMFLTDVSFARDSRLINIYGLSSAAPTNITSANAVRFPAGERAGLLTRGAMLIGGSELANPVKRGIHVRKNILCLNLDAPPAGLAGALQPPAANENMTTRQRYDNATSSSTCMGCHQYINSMGHAFSNYNSIGQFVTQEPTFTASGSFSGRYLPVDSRVDLSTSLAQGLSAQNAVDFSNLVANQRNTQTCFSERYLAFTEGRAVDKNKEGCRLNSLYNHLNKAHTFKDFVRSTAADAEFRYRLLAD